jgi:aryl-alcohol dehydrogenase-like predicted oxidoreductase
VETVRLGRTDMRVSRVGMGACQFSGDTWGAISYEQAKAVVAKAVDVGINFFDTAAVYGRGRSEEYLGRVVKELGLRDRIYIATKIHGEWLRRVDNIDVGGERRRSGLDAFRRRLEEARQTRLGDLAEDNLRDLVSYRQTSRNRGA